MATTMNEVENNNNSSDQSNHVILDKKVIPELMIPSFETNPTDEIPGCNNASIAPIISPDSTAANTKSTKSTEIGSLECASSPPSPSHMNRGPDEIAEASPTNPSAPLTSPPKTTKPSTSSQQNHDQSTSSSTGAPPKADGNDNVFKNVNMPPAPISQRGRVVSVDRYRYMNTLNSVEYPDDDDDDDDLSNSFAENSDDGSKDEGSVSSDEGSYFSEHLPSPPRRRESVGSSNPRLLPPGGGGGAMRGHNRVPSMYSHQSRQYSMSHESDLSLSSSDDELDQQNQHINLANAYPITQTRSDPVTGSKLQPRYSSKVANLDLVHHSESKQQNNRDRLNTISGPTEEQLSIPVPKNAKQFPSTSSLVSSSSEDVERKNVKPSKHRRQSSYRSVGSISTAGSAFLPEKPDKMSDSEYANIPNKPPEMVSFSGSSSRKNSSEHRIPKYKSYHDSRKNQQVATLSDDQMSAWKSGGGITRSDSYVSSSHGNLSGTETSPDRMSRNFNESASVSNGSRQSSHISHSGSGIFIYSEDETDESIKYRRNRERNHDEAEFASNGQRPSSSRSRSFGTDLTNAEEIEPPPSNAQINPIPDRRSQKLYENQSGSISSSHNQSSYVTVNEMYNDSETFSSMSRSRAFKVYWKRWLMLIYMSLLNLLSDWTCFSVAPIALLTKDTFQIVNPEHLVTIFLFANTVSTATEPILLARLGLRKTVVFGSFLLMVGNVLKSGGIPGFIGSGIEDETDAWRLFLGFFLVGLSQPLYQCTPSILSSSWFPEKERTLATGVALNSNQLGIGCSFIFGSLLVVTSDDISNYFGFLSLLSTLVFIGCYLQFQDAPPTPPSETARVMKGNIMFPNFNNMQQSIPGYFRRFQGPVIPHQVDPYDNMQRSQGRETYLSGFNENRSTNRIRTDSNENITVGSRSSRRSNKRSDRKGRESPTNAFKSASRSKVSRRSSGDHVSRPSNRRQRSNGSRSMKSDVTSRSRRREPAHGLASSPALGAESTSAVSAILNNLDNEAGAYGTIAPSPMMSGHVGNHVRRNDEGYYDTPHRNDGGYGYQQQHHYTPHAPGNVMSTNYRRMPNYYGHQHDFVDHSGGVPDTPFPNLRYMNTNSASSGKMNNSHNNTHATPYDYRDTPMQYFPPHIDPRYYYQQAPMPPGAYNDAYQDQNYRPFQYPNSPYMYDNSKLWLSSNNEDEGDEGVEPVLMHAGSSLSIDIRDDQILRSIRACFSRPGFIHTVIAFAVSGIVLNTISTYMDSLLSPSGAGRGAVGLIGGLFQVLVMASSMIIGKITDRKRAYYCVVILLLLLGAFVLAECAINLEADRGSDLKWTLLILAVFVGPLQPVATELGVEVVYPLSENTVLVVQQLVSNLTSAIFIPFFQEARDFAKEGEDFERPQYTFSFIVLMATHVLATIFFASFNGKYKRYEHEQRRKKDHTSESNKKKEPEKDEIIDEEKQTLLR